MNSVEKLFWRMALIPMALLVGSLAFWDIVVEGGLR